MKIIEILRFFEEYGGIVLFILMFLECLNIPGFPGGYTAIAAGIAVRLKSMNFIEAYIISVIASVLSMLLLYFLCKLFHEPIERYFNKTEKRKNLFKRATNIVQKHGFRGVFISRLIPILRTFISIPAGILSMNLINYSISSLLGTSIYVFLNIGAGYFLTSFFI